MFQFVAVTCSGAFFGATLYITLVQHPAMLAAGLPFAARFFSPMYHRAAALQATLAIVGSAAALVAWLRGATAVWLVAALLLFAVVPFTLLIVKPVNDQLFALGRDADVSAIEPLLRQWSRLHAVRTVLSGIAFAVLVASV